MPPTATLQQDDGSYRPRLVRTPDGYVGTRYYQISNDCDSLEEALTATDLPAMGAAWSGTAPGTVLFAREFEVLVEPGDWYYVKVEYRQNRGGDITPVAGLVNTTAIRHQSTSETVLHDITGTYRLGEDGTQKILSTFDIMVDQYLASAGDLVAALPALVDLSDEPKLNEFAIECPNLFGSGTALAIPARQALYTGFEVEQVGDLYRVRHLLQWRRDWDWSGLEIGDDLTPLASFVPQAVYEEADFVSVFDPA
jgi:hypothetical protein